MSALRYRRILLKLGGEALAGEGGFGIDPHEADVVAAKVRRLRDLGAEVAIVIGAGNLWRGKDGQAHGMEQTTADHMGMLATVMNSLALADALHRVGLESRVMTAIEMRSVAEPYIRGRAVRHLEKGRVVIFAGGTGNPYFSTDTAAALRACEIGADVFIKGTRVDGVYTADPEKDPSARRYLQLTYQEAIERNLNVLDGPAFVMCRDNKLPIVICDITKPGRLAEVLRGTGAHTIVKDFTNSVLE